MKRSEIRTAEQAFISCLVAELGGPSKVAKKLGCKVQDIINWRLRGRVPAHFCIQLWAAHGKTLIAPLNWKHFKKLAKHSWEEAIKLCELSEDRVNFILSFPPPKV